MSPDGLGGTARRLVAPLAYAVAYVFSIYLVGQALISDRLFLIWIAWKTYHETPVLYYGVPPMLICLMFGLCGMSTLRLERVARPGVGDHLRRCVFLYFGLLSMVVVFSVSLLQGMPEHVLALIGAAGIVPAALAILIDAAILSRQRRRVGRTDPGDPA